MRYIQDKQNFRWGYLKSHHGLGVQSGMKMAVIRTGLLCQPWYHRAVSWDLYSFLFLYSTCFVYWIFFQYMMFANDLQIYWYVTPTAEGLNTRVQELSSDATAIIELSRGSGLKVDSCKTVALLLGSLQYLSLPVLKHPPFFFRWKSEY